MSNRILLVVFMLAAPTFALKVGDQLEENYNQEPEDFAPYSPEPEVFINERREAVPEDVQPDEEDIMQRRRERSRKQELKEEAEKNPEAPKEELPRDPDELGEYTESQVGIEGPTEDGMVSHGMGYGDILTEDQPSEAYLEAERSGAPDEVIAMAPRRRRELADHEAAVDAEGMRAYDDVVAQNEEMERMIEQQKIERPSASDEDLTARTDDDDDDKEIDQKIREREEELEEKGNDADYDVPRFGFGYEDDVDGSSRFDSDENESPGMTGDATGDDGIA